MTETEQTEYIGRIDALDDRDAELVVWVSAIHVWTIPAVS